MKSENKNFLEGLLLEEGLISELRKKELNALGALIEKEVEEESEANVMFICTHNSRRSHIAEIMLRFSAEYYDLKNLGLYSSGTEATAFNIRTINAFSRAGFKINVVEKGDNPRYRVGELSGDGRIPLSFSKVYNDPYNPSSGFIAVMVCSDAEQNCPFIPGAVRFSLKYDDPKVSDDSPKEEETYDKKLREIGREMMYLARKIKKQED